MVFLDVTAAGHLHDELEFANRQLGTAYEELQSTVEELQSTNEELQTINEELRDRTAELDSVNAFMEAIVTNLRAGVAVLNREMQVRVWNRRAEDLWGLRPDEAIGQHFLNLDIGSDQLRPMIRRVLNDGVEPQAMRLRAVNRRGRTIDVRVVGSPLVHDGDGTIGAILVIDPADQSADGSRGQPVSPVSSE